MKNYSLSIYRISINERLSKDDLLILSDYNNGQDLLQQLKEFFNINRNEISPKEASMIKDDVEKKISRIFKNSNGTYEYSTNGRYISGIIESGEYGTVENIIDSTTGELKYKKQSVDAQMIPFFFMFNIPENSHYGYLVLERISNLGIYSTLINSIRKFLGKSIQDDVVLKVEPFFIQEILNHNLNVISDAKKIIVKGVNYKKIGLGNIVNNLTTDNIQADIIFKAPRNGSIHIPDLFNMLRINNKKNNIYTFNNIEYADISFELKMGGKTKTITLGNITNLGTNIEMPKDIEIGSNGYPTYKSLLTEAQQLLSYIKDEKE